MSLGYRHKPQAHSDGPGVRSVDFVHVMHETYMHARKIEFE